MAGERLYVRPLQNQRGVALIAVLVAVSLLGLMAGIAGSSWQTIRQRDREAELLWRGGQIRKAIESYYTMSHGQGTQKIYPSSLDNLVKDPRFVETRRHLRRLYLDPITGEDWIVLKDPNGRIIGVRSRSELTPFKQDNFSEENKDLAGKQSYSEWLFVYEAKTAKKKTPTGSRATGANPSAATPGHPATGGATK